MVRAVLVGCGAMSRTWLEAAKSAGVTIVGLVDVDVERARERAAGLDTRDVVLGADLEAVLDQVRPDVVFDVAVPEVRRAIALSAFRHGCHLLTEKPLAATPDDARAIVAAAKDAGRVHAVIQNRRYLAEPRRIRRFLASGAIGNPTSIHCDFFLAPHFGGFREAMDHVLLLDMAIHTFDAGRFLVDRAPLGVFCREWEPAGSWYQQGSSAAAVFDLSDGVVFTYRGSWCADGLGTSWESTWRIVGERGSLTWDGYQDVRAEVRSSGRDGLFDRTEALEIPPLDPSDRVGGHLGVMQDFLAAVRDGTEPETRGSDNIRSLMMTFGAIESAETGRHVRIES